MPLYSLHPRFCPLDVGERSSLRLSLVISFPSARSIWIQRDETTEHPPSLPYPYALLAGGSSSST